MNMQRASRDVIREYILGCGGKAKINSIVSFGATEGIEKKTVLNYLKTVGRRNEEIICTRDEAYDTEYFLKTYWTEIDEVSKIAEQICIEKNIKKTDANWIFKKVSGVADFDLNPLTMREILKLSGRFEASKGNVLICMKSNGFMYDTINDLLAEIYKDQYLPVSIRDVVKKLDAHGRTYSKTTFHNYVLSDSSCFLERWHENGLIAKTRKETINMNVQKILNMERHDITRKVYDALGIKGPRELSSSGSNLKTWIVFFEKTKDKRRFIIGLAESDIDVKKLFL